MRKQDTNVLIRVSTELKDQMQAKAEEKGMSMATYIRSTMIKALKDEQ